MIDKFHDISKNLSLFKFKEVRTMKILSLDQSTSCTGYAIFENNELKNYGVIRPSKKINTNNMISMFLRIVEIIQKEKADIILIEDVYLKKGKKFNVHTHKVLSNLQGMLIAYFVLNQIEYYVITPKTWQSTIINKSTVTKEDTLSFVNKKYSIHLENNNISDAICIGLSFIEKNPVSM